MGGMEPSFSFHTKLYISVISIPYPPKLLIYFFLIRPFCIYFFKARLLGCDEPLRRRGVEELSPGEKCVCGEGACPGSPRRGCDGTC